MKKTLLLMALLFVVTLGAKAQMISAEDLEKYCIKFLKLPEKPKDKDWITAAQRLKDSEEVGMERNHSSRRRGQRETLYHTELLVHHDLQ